MMIDTNLAVSTVTPEIVDYVIEKIVETIHPSKIILFGSQVNHTNQKDSDIDLLVVINSGEDREQMRLEIERVLRGRRFGIDLLVRTPEDVKWNIEVENPFYVDDILREGQVMYEY